MASEFVLAVLKNVATLITIETRDNPKRPETFHISGKKTLSLFQ